MPQVKIDYSNPQALLQLLAAMNLPEGIEITVEKQENGILLKPIPSTKEPNPLSKRELSRKWLADNRETYAGKWVVLDGDILICSGTNGRLLCEEARSKGIQTPFLAMVEPADSLPFAGW
jgi:hypothetical protein